MKQSEGVSPSQHFKLEALTQGVYAAIARPEGWARSNGGIIDLGERTLVIDAFLSPQAADDLRLAAETMFGRPVDMVLLTHHHADHVWGFQSFNACTNILATREVFRLLTEKGEENLQNNRQNIASQLQALQVQQAEEKDPTKRGQLSAAIATLKEQQRLVESIHLRQPNLTCEGKVTFFGSLRTAEFIPYELGHSPGNAVIHLPQDGILFLGDLLFARRHPFMGDGSPEGWIRSLQQVEELAPRLVVPGHGELASLEEVRETAEYMRLILQKLQEVVQAGKGEEALVEIVLPEPFASWEPQTLLERSLKALYRMYQPT